MKSKLTILIVLLPMLGCESRAFFQLRPDGTETSYRRVSLFSDSTSEGVTVTKDGDDLIVEVGSTGSKTDTEAILRGIELGMKLAAPTP